jgi:hypothetical protein
MASIQIVTTVVGFSNAFSDQGTAVACDTKLENETDLTALVAAQTGTLTTRTDDNTGVATLSTGHGITTGMVCDVYWAAGVRYGMDATVSSNAITLDGGAGDVLPLQDVACTVVQQTEVNVNFDGDDALVIAVVYRNPNDTGAKAHVDFQDTGNASIQEIDLTHETVSGGLVRNVNLFNISAGDTNVFTGNRITHCAASHDSTSAGTLYIYVAYNA